MAALFLEMVQLSITRNNYIYTVHHVFYVYMH